MIEPTPRCLTRPWLHAAPDRAAPAPGRHYVLLMASGRLRRLDDDLFAGRLTRRTGCIAARALILWFVVGVLLGFALGWPLTGDSAGCFGCIPLPIYTAVFGGIVGVVVALTRIALARRRCGRNRT